MTVRCLPYDVCECIERGERCQVSSPPVGRVQIDSIDVRCRKQMFAPPPVYLATVLSIVMAPIKIYTSKCIVLSSRPLFVFGACLPVVCSLRTISGCECAPLHVWPHPTCSFGNRRIGRISAKRLTRSYSGWRPKPKGTELKREPGCGTVNTYYNINHAKEETALRHPSPLPIRLVTSLDTGEQSTSWMRPLRLSLS